MAAYHSALSSQVDCIEIDVSRSSDGVLLALHDSFGLQIKHLGSIHQSAEFHDTNIPTIEERLKVVSSSVRQVILDIKVGHPSYEKGLAKDVLDLVQRIQCRNCIVWAKSDNLARDVIRLASDVMVGYIVMIDQSTGTRTNLLRMRDVLVVAVYRPLIDEMLVRTLHGRNKKVDDVESMEETCLIELGLIYRNSENYQC